jgi:hypothetical protein
VSRRTTVRTTQSLTPFSEARRRSALRQGDPPRDKAHGDENTLKCSTTTGAGGHIGAAAPVALAGPGSDQLG